MQEDEWRVLNDPHMLTMTLHARAFPDTDHPAPGHTVQGLKDGDPPAVRGITMDPPPTLGPNHPPVVQQSGGKQWQGHQQWDSAPWN